MGAAENHRLVCRQRVLHRHELVDLPLGDYQRSCIGCQLGLFCLAVVVLAVVGILWLAVPVGQIPWVALLLTFSFGLYGLVRKLAPLGALPGLVLETLLMLPFAASYLLYAGRHGGLVFAELNLLQTALLVGSGIATTVPLILFASAARRIPLSTLGVIQYGSPTLQLLLGLVLFGESFDTGRLIGYGWVWLGVALYFSGILQTGKKAV